MARKMSAWEKAIRHELIDRDMNMSDLADELGISVTYIYDVINDNRKATDIRQRINDFLGLDGEG
jgi:plasmid maintenance system antidote protein VapI